MTALLLTATVDVQAASGDQNQPSVSIVAYGGGVIRPGGWSDLIIDVAGVSAADQLPILLDHDASTSGVTGHGAATMRNGIIKVDGKLIPGIEATDKLLALHKGGLKMQASVGLDPITTRRLKAGEKTTINGRTITAGERGLTVVDAGTLKEVSILPLGADGGTSVSIAARKGQTKMASDVIDSAVDGTNPNATDLIQAERDRCDAIMTVCGDGHRDIAARAVKEGWDRNRAELEVRRASRPKAPAIHSGRDIGGDTKAVLSAALLCRMGQEAAAVKAHGERVVEAARRSEAVFSLVDLCRAAIRLENGDVPNDRSELIRAAFSTVSLPSAISDAVHSAVKMQYAEVPVTWRAFAAIKAANDFRDHTLLQSNLEGGLDQVGAGGEVHHSSMDVSTWTYRIHTFAKQFRVTRRDVINDHVGALADLPAIFAKQAARRVSDLVYEVLLGNAGSHFSAGNANYLSGGSSALSVTSLGSALTKIRTQRDDDDNDLDIQPRVLLVPPELEQTARGVLESEYIAQFVDGTTKDTRPTGNPVKQRLELQVEPRLSNTGKFSGASTTGWYVLAGPADTPFVVAYLDGIEAPRVEFFGLDSDPNTLGVAWRVYSDFGAALGDKKAGVLSAGA